MKKEIEINERIESFLNDDLSSEEMQEFKNQLEDDPLLVQEVELHRQLRVVITDGAWLNVKNELGSIRLRKIRQLKRIKRATGFGFGGFLACIILILIFRNVPDKPKIIRESSPAEIRQEIKDHFPPEPKKVIRKSDPGIIDQAVPPDGKTKSKDPESIRQETLIPVPEKSAERKQEHGDSMNLVNKPDTMNGGFVTGSSGKVSSADKTTKQAETGISGKTDCRKVTIQAKFLTQESCNNKPTGSFVIDRGSITGGRPPYAFSLNHERFHDTTAFYLLYPGNYPVYVKDDNNCIELLGTARIGSVDCTYQAVFAPMKGESWTIPVNHVSDGILQVYSKAGTIVFYMKFTQDESPVWSGGTITGQALPMAIYQFQINYDDGSSFTGNVTIVR
jgi:hypothetical protein